MATQDRCARYDPFVVCWVLGGQRGSAQACSCDLGELQPAGTDPIGSIRMRRLSTLLALCLTIALVVACGGGTVAVTGTGPDITNIVPASGGTAGGTPLVIRGTNLANPVPGDYQVLIGGQPATEIEVVDDTEVRCTTPFGALGAADVEIVTVEGAGMASGGFMYYPPPTVTSITPNEGSRDGGTPVTVTGTAAVTWT